MAKSKFLIILMFSLGVLFTRAQSFDSLEIAQVYETWEETVLNKQTSEHLDLYLYNQAPVYIIKKNATGPSFYGSLTASQFANIFSQPGSYQLDISDINVVVDQNFAITNAHFDEYINDNFSAFGRDMFGYIRTSEGWKLLFLHNTVILANDGNDYSIPIELPNTVEGNLVDFQRYFNNKNGDSIREMFVNQNNQVITFDGELDSDYQYLENRVSSFLNEVNQMGDEINISFGNQQIHYVDHYLASAFFDYIIKNNEEPIEEGRAWMSMLGDMQYGWRISSFTRDVSSSQITGVVNRKKKENNISIQCYLKSRDELSANIDLGKSKNGKIRIINSNGEIMQTIILENIKSGKQDIAIALKNVKPGLNFCHLFTADGEFCTDKFIYL